MATRRAALRVVAGTLLVLPLLLGRSPEWPKRRPLQMGLSFTGEERNSRRSSVVFIRFHGRRASQCLVGGGDGKAKPEGTRRVGSRRRTAKGSKTKNKDVLADANIDDGENEDVKLATNSTEDPSAVYAQIARSMGETLNSIGPVVNCVILDPNGTARAEMIDTTPRTINNEYERLLGVRQMTIVGQMHPSDVVMLGLEKSSGDYNHHQPLPGAHKRNVRGPIICLRMGKDGEPRNYTLTEHEEFMARYREENPKGDEDMGDGNDGMGYEEYYSSENDDEDEDDDEDDDYDDDADEEYDDDDDDLYEEYDYYSRRGDKPGLAQQQIEREFREKNNRYPTELELANEMARVKLDDKKPDRATRKIEEDYEEEDGSLEDDDEEEDSYYTDEDDDEDDDDGADSDTDDENIADEEDDEDEEEEDDEDEEDDEEGEEKGDEGENMEFEEEDDDENEDADDEDAMDDYDDDDFSDDFVYNEDDEHRGR